MFSRWFFFQLQLHARTYTGLGISSRSSAITKLSRQAALEQTYWALFASTSRFHKIVSGIRAGLEKYRKEYEISQNAIDML